MGNSSSVVPDNESVLISEEEDTADGTSSPQERSKMEALEAEVIDYYHQLVETTARADELQDLVTQLKTTEPGEAMAEAHKLQAKLEAVSERLRCEERDNVVASNRILELEAELKAVSRASETQIAGLHDVLDKQRTLMSGQATQLEDLRVGVRMYEDELESMRLIAKIQDKMGGVRLSEANAEHQKVLAAMREEQQLLQARLERVAAKSIEEGNAMIRENEMSRGSADAAKLADVERELAEMKELTQELMEEQEAETKGLEQQIARLKCQLAATKGGGGNE